MLNGVEAVWILYFIQHYFVQHLLNMHPFNFCWMNVGEMLKPFQRALTGAVTLGNFVLQRLLVSQFLCTVVTQVDYYMN